MSSNSEKHRYHVNKPLRLVELSQIPGIGEERIQEIKKDFFTPLSLWEYFHCEYQSNRTTFADHMKERYNMYSNHAEDLANFFQEWEENRLFPNNS